MPPEACTFTLHALILSLLPIDAGTEKAGIMRNSLEEIADRWMRARRALMAEDQKYAHELVSMILAHSRDPISVLDDPLEAAVFSLLIELEKRSAR